MDEGNVMISKDWAYEIIGMFNRCLVSSAITFIKIIFLNRSEGGRRPTKPSMCLGCKEKVLFAPLWHPDILGNPDTCLFQGSATAGAPHRPSMISSEVGSLGKSSGTGIMINNLTNTHAIPPAPAVTSTSGDMQHSCPTPIAKY